MVAVRRRRVDLHGADAEVLQILALQSREPRRIRRVLDLRNPVSPSLLPHVIDLLGVTTVAANAMQALQSVADERPGALVDALLDQGRPRAVRRRLARVLSVCRSQSVFDGLMMAMGDEALDVRVQCGRALFRICQRNPGQRIDAESMLNLVRKELAQGAPDLAHVFTLLSFVLPVAPLRAAYRSLRGHDQRSRGTALEYLNGVLSRDIRESLWPILERRED
jgi:hypothetical protein